MRKLGILAIAVGVIVVISALGMDVSVSSGMGSRVNNLGLIADRQNYMMVGGLMVITGLLMTIFFKSSSPSAGSDERPCPFCAEAIKVQAIKCKHCGSEVEPVSAQVAEAAKVANAIPTKPWFVTLPFDSKKHYLAIAEKVRELGHEVHSETSRYMRVGPYRSKDDAGDVLQQLLMIHQLHGNLEEAKELN